MAVTSIDERSSLTPARSGSGARSVIVVDPSCYSLPYDYSLCDALTRQGWKATLERSTFLHGKLDFEPIFPVREDFYRLTHRFARSRGTAWKLVKGAEHVVSTLGLLRRIRRQRPDIVHYQWLMAPPVDSYLLKRARRIAPVVLTLHNTDFFHGIAASNLQAVGFRSVFKHVDAVVVHCAYSKRRIIEESWIDDDKIHVIPHGVLECYRGSKEVVDTPVRGSSENTILFFGAIAPYKGVDLLLQAFAAMTPETRSSTRLVVAGRADMDITPLRELATQLGIARRVDWRIRFFEESEIPALFRDATVVALPYREIDQSGVLLTAIAFEKPVVAFSIGGIPETIQHGKHGLLVEPGNIGGYAQALETVITDGDCRRSMQEAMSHLRTSELAWHNIARQTAALYERLLRHKQAQPPERVPVAAAV